MKRSFRAAAMWYCRHPDLHIVLTILVVCAIVVGGLWSQIEENITGVGAAICIGSFLLGTLSMKLYDWIESVTGRR